MDGDLLANVTSFSRLGRPLGGTMRTEPLQGRWRIAKWTKLTTTLTSILTGGRA